jgi:hypothetical protein
VDENVKVKAVMMAFCFTFPPVLMLKMLASFAFWCKLEEGMKIIDLLISGVAIIFKIIVDFACGDGKTSYICSPL